LGWVSATPFKEVKEALADTIQWYRKNEWWWKPLRQ